MAEKCFYYWKDRNKLCICEGSEQTDRFFYLDVNDLSIHGLSGRKVKNVPTGFGHTLKEETWYGQTKFVRTFDNPSTEIVWKAVTIALNTWQPSACIESIVALEKLVNALYAQGIVLTFQRYSWMREIETLQEAIDNKKYSYREMLDSLGNVQTVDLYDLYMQYETKRVYGEYSAHFETLGTDFTKKVVQRFQGSPDWDRWQNVVWAWLEHPQVRACKDMLHYPEYTIIQAIQDALRHCRLLNREPEKGVPFLQWQILKRDYLALQDEIKTETLKSTQRPDFTFEDENYIAIVPTTLQEFVDEGNAMGNCIGGIWLNGYANQIEQGIMARGALFIRAKAQPNVPFIDCDFDLETGEISQFYGKYNREVGNNLPIIRFREALQKHLTKVCGDRD